jgi:Mannosyltransferase putative
LHDLRELCTNPGACVFRVQEINDGLPCFLWRSKEFRKARIEFAKAVPLRDIEAVAEGLNKGKGRGIVIASGGFAQLANTFASLLPLRKMGCTLPIEIWHTGGEQGDVDRVRQVFEVSAQAMLSAPLLPALHAPRLRGWHAWPIAHCVPAAVNRQPIVRASVDRARSAGCPPMP